MSQNQIKIGQVKLISKYNAVANKLNQIYPPPENYQLPILSEGGVCNGLSAYWIFANSMGGERLNGFKKILDKIIASNDTDGIINILEKKEWENFDEFASFFEMVNQLQMPQGKLNYLGQYKLDKIFNLLSPNLPNFHTVNKLSVTCDKTKLSSIIKNTINKGKYFMIYVPGHHAMAISVEGKRYRFLDPNEGEKTLNSEEELIESYLTAYKYHVTDYKDGDPIKFQSIAISENRSDVKNFLPKSKVLDDIFQDATQEELQKAFAFAIHIEDYNTSIKLLDKLEKIHPDNFNLSWFSPSIIEHPKILSKILNFYLENNNPKDKFKDNSKKKNIYNKWIKDQKNFKNGEYKNIKYENKNSLLQLCLLHNKPKSAEILIRYKLVAKNENYDLNIDGKSSYDIAIETGHFNLAEKIAKLYKTRKNKQIIDKKSAISKKSENSYSEYEPFMSSDEYSETSEIKNRLVAEENTFQQGNSSSHYGDGDRDLEHEKVIAFQYGDEVGYKVGGKVGDKDEIDDENKSLNEDAAASIIQSYARKKKKPII